MNVRGTIAYAMLYVVLYVEDTTVKHCHLWKNLCSYAIPFTLLSVCPSLCRTQCCH